MPINISINTIGSLEVIGDISIGSLSTDTPNDIKLGIQAYDEQSFLIDIPQADFHEIEINLLEIFSSHFIKIKIALKNFVIKIGTIILKGDRIDYEGEISPEQLIIETQSPYVSLPGNLVTNVKIDKSFDEHSTVVRDLLRSVSIIPGSGEYVLDPNLSESKESLKSLVSFFPNTKWIAPVVTWFATDLNISETKILPGVDVNFRHPEGQTWSVAGFTTGTSHKISLDEAGAVNYGGTTNDKSVVDFLVYAKENYGFQIIFYPFVMVDAPLKPWRGRMTGAPEDVDKFFFEQYKPFVLHYATLVKGYVDAFIIGSEFVGLTKIHTDDNDFPFVRRLIELARDVKSILGPSVKITYAADWSEYHTADGVQRPLDELFASDAIDFVGIDAYFPLTNLNKSDITVDEIKLGWHSGEGIDFYLDSEG